MRKIFLIMRKIIILLLLLFTGLSSFSQNYILKGKVYDLLTHEQLEGVAVGVKQFPTNGTVTDGKGEYKLRLAPGEYTLVFRLLGYHQLEIPVKMEAKDQVFNVDLEAESLSLNEVEISVLKKDENVKGIQMGMERLEVKAISRIPVLFGEKDILKTIQLLPGVQTAGEGNSGFYVRGGSSDQNLILIDNATVYNPSHLFGFFSTFNSDAVQDMTIYKGLMPAQYGGRLSSALDVAMRDGNMNDYTITGGIGLISSRLTVEGPIQKNKSSFIVSGRRTYADALGRLAGVEAVKNSSLYFYDLNAKLSYVLSDRDKITLTGYYGEDILGMKDITKIGWGNGIAALKWNHIFSDRLSSSTSFNFTNYSYDVNINFIRTSNFKISSRIMDYNFIQEFTFLPNEHHNIKMGFNSVFHHLTPGNVDIADGSQFVGLDSFKKRKGWDNSLYINDNIKVNDRLELGLGLRFSTSSVLGGGEFYEYDKDMNITKKTATKNGEFVKTYYNIEPRISSVFHLNETSSLKAAFARTAQNMHLLKISNMEATPTDRWLFNTNFIEPEISNQVSLGYFRNFDDNMFEFSAEVYYKNLENQMDYKDGTVNVHQTENLEPFLLKGKGRAYGLELFLKKKYGRFNGWIGYTLSRSERKIDGINNGDWYIANQDRTHDLSIVGMYELNRKWTLSATWVYTSGAPISFPSARYVVDGHVLYYYDKRNNFKTPAYHRLDLGATCILKKTKKFSSELSFGLYNAYGRKNPYMYDFRQSKGNTEKSEVVKYYLFTFVPSISWDFKF